MKKPKLLGTGNEGEFNYITISKEKDFFKWFNNFCSKSFTTLSPSVLFENDEDDKLKNIKDFLDKHEHYTANDARIDVFYGNKKIFITIYCKIEKRKEFTKVLSKTIKKLK